MKLLEILYHFKNLSVHVTCNEADLRVQYSWVTPAGDDLIVLGDGPMDVG